MKAWLPPWTKRSARSRPGSICNLEIWSVTCWTRRAIFFLRNVKSWPSSWRSSTIKWLINSSNSKKGQRVAYKRLNKETRRWPCWRIWSVSRAPAWRPSTPSMIVPRLVCMTACYQNWRNIAASGFKKMRYFPSVISKLNWRSNSTIVSWNRKDSHFFWRPMLSKSRRLNT